MFSTLMFFHLGYDARSSSPFALMERVYFTHDLAKKGLRVRARIEASQNAHDASKISFSFKIKDAYLQIDSPVLLRFGYQPALFGFYDSFWGYRVLYKDVLGAFNLASTRDLGLSVGYSSGIFALRGMLSEAYIFGDGVYMVSGSASLEKSFFSVYGYSGLKFGKIPASGLGLLMIGLKFDPVKISFAGFYANPRVGVSLTSVFRAAQRIDLVLRADGIYDAQSRSSKGLGILAVSFLGKGYKVIPNFVGKFSGNKLSDAVFRISFEWK